MHAVNEGEVEYKRLPEYFAMRKRELSGMVEPYIDVTDAYGELICSLVLTLGEKGPDDTQDEVCRDLLADVFDFLYDARRAILESQFSVIFRFFGGHSNRPRCFPPVLWTAASLRHGRPARKSPM